MLLQLSVLIDLSPVYPVPLGRADCCPVCGQIRNFRVQTTVSRIPRALPDTTRMSLHSWGRVYKHLPPASQLHYFWLRWLYLWWLCCNRWSKTLWQFERHSDFSLQLSSIADSVQVRTRGVSRGFVVFQLDNSASPSDFSRPLEVFETWPRDLRNCFSLPVVN
jgi:hypothetical protein